MRWMPILIALFAGSICLQAQPEGGQEPTTPPPDATTEAAPAQDSAAQPDVATSAPTPEPAEAAAPPAPQWTRPPVPPAEDGVANIYVIPIHEEINKTNKYVLRRGLKAAIDNKAEVVLLDIDTPGGRSDVMLEMMEMLDRFDGRTIAYVDDEAMSAGALISAAADDIYFAPTGIIGAAAVISGTGEDIPETLKKKIDSYMDAKLRSLMSKHPRRADVLRAMMQDDYVLELDGKVISPKDKLLSLTATEAMTLYGAPPSPLFGSGIYANPEALAQAEYGAGSYAITTYETTWSEEAAMFMEQIQPLLMGLGFLLLMLEFYTPGFGFLGISGIALLGVVFLSNFIAGLAGHEPLILFGIGFLMVILELLLLPGMVFMAVTGLMLMLASLVWSLSDVWPTPGGGIVIDWSNVVWALGDILLAVLVAGVLFYLLYKLLPKRLVWDRLVLQGAVGGAPGAALVAPGAVGVSTLPAPGARGVAVSNLRPTGTVEIDGVRYEASLGVGSAERGDPVVVTGQRNFYILVDKLDE